MARRLLPAVALAAVASVLASCGIGPLARPVGRPNEVTRAAAKARVWPPARLSARVETISGGRSPSDAGHVVNVPAAQARYAVPNGLTWAAGRLYVSHARNYVVTMLHDRGGTRFASEFAGLAHQVGGQDGVGRDARFYDPQDLATGPDGVLYMVEFHGGTIRSLRPTAAGGAVGTVIPPSPEPVLSGPYGIAVGRSGTIYVSDLTGRQVVKVERLPGGDVRQTVLYEAATEEDPVPYCLTVDDQENVYFGSNRTIFAMTSTGADRRVVVDQLPELAWDMVHANGHLVVAAMKRVFDVELATRKVTLVAGRPTVGADDGVGAGASFTNAASICFGEPGVLYVADSANHRICRLSFE